MEYILIIKLLFIIIRNKVYAINNELYCTIMKN